METAQSLAGYRLSPLQEDAWPWLQGPTGCWAHCAFDIEGPVDAAVLRDAFDQAVARHEILRTTFYRRSGLKFPYQVIHQDLAPSWEHVDLDGLPVNERAERAKFLMRDEAQRPLDLEAGPVLRICLISFTHEKHILSARLPSICADSRTLINLIQHVAYSMGNAAASEEKHEILQYADYAEWLRELIESDDVESRAARAFWSGLGIGSIPDTTLPFERRAEPGGSFEPATIELVIPDELLSGIERVAADQGISTRAVTLACWCILLGRFTGRSSILTAVVSGGRTQSDLLDSMGLFERALPISCQFELEQPWANVAAQLEAILKYADLYQDYFPRDLAIAPGPEAGRLPLEIEWIGPIPKIDVAGARWRIKELYSHEGPLRLKLSIIVGAETSWLARFQYDPRRYRSESVERLAESFETILGSAVRQPAATVAELDLVSPVRMRELLVSFNQTAADYSRETCIHYLFEDQVRRTPDRLALVFEDRQLSYHELNSWANQIAHYLRGAGVRPGVAVGLCTERSLEMIVGLLGIFKAGGAYVPIHPEQPKARLSYQLQESGAFVLLTQEGLLGGLPDFDCRIICLDRDRALLETESRTDPERTTTGDDLVYVIYTSGSTGAPKGVAVRHRNLVNYSQFIVRRLGISEVDRLTFATVSTLSADLGNTCVFPALTSGGCLHVISHETSMDGTLYAEYVARNTIDVLKITPSHLGALAAAGIGLVLPRRFLVLGGEAASWDLIEQISRAGACEIINHYGPTEATIGALTFGVSDHAARQLSPTTVPIGRPIANAQVYILDARMQPMPLGVVGELWIGGAGVAQGYLKQPEQTADRFVADPFSTEPGARLYRTGDLARYLPDGNVEFLGRIDHQVKIRGFRVELGEIEAVLSLHPAVRQAVVVAHEQNPGDQRLAAYLVAASATPPDPAELRAALAERLPHYMMPSTFVMMSELPLTPNGKVDRNALPAPQESRGSTGFVAPRTPTEERLASIWREVLGKERVGITDDFFELGGHSLLATQVILRIRNAFNVQLPLRTLFETPMVSALAQTITEIQSQDVENPEFDQILAELEGLSDEEVQRFLTADQIN
jgi:amino acid adenylation domain-containing protein